MKSLSIRSTQRNQFLEITEQIREIVRSSQSVQGIVIVFCPHTTAGMTINENADPDVVHDMLLYLNDKFPQQYPGFCHAEGNSDSHLKASFMGSSVTVLIEKGEIVLGRWQGIYLCEFDGPRTRQILVQVV